ncbi:glutathione S-transferase family protein [Leptospira interrogans]
MMKLLSSPASPYGRKVKITALMKGVTDQISVEKIDTGLLKNEALYRENPLAKIPVLILEDGLRIYDSHVICEYLDILKPEPHLFPAGGRERIDTLVRGALGDGILDAALLLVYEGRYRPAEMRVQSWVDRLQLKIDQSLGELEKAPPQWNGTPDYGHITIACALGYLDFRHQGVWRADHPKLVAWLDKFAAAVPAFAATTPE